ncbi:MAG: sensor histidine kinase [Magnetococcales bacterium]|nr:sensor histidine kinase [Magnetococcales bacterium]
MNPSLRRQLALGLAVALLVVLAAQWLLQEISIRETTHRFVVSRLAHDADNLLVNLRMDANGKLSLAETHLPPVFSQPLSGHYYQITFAGGELRSRSLWDQSLSLPELRPGEERIEERQGPNRQPLLQLAKGYQRQDRFLLVVVAEELTDMASERREARLRNTLLSLCTILLLLFWQQRLLSRAIDRLVIPQRALQRTPTELTSLETRGVPQEILPFIEEINRLLASLGQRLLRARNAAGNMAHAIKTPLAILMQLGEHPDLQHHTDLRETILQQSHAIRRLVERELKKSRLAGCDGPLPRIRPREELEILLTTLESVHRQRNIHIEQRISSDFELVMDPEDFLELTGNLLDNGCKWATRRVRLTACNRANDILVRVEDDGPGLPPEAWTPMMERGVRFHPEVAGSGVGLAVVAEIALNYGGRIEPGRSEELGGFSIQFVLPSPARKSIAHDPVSFWTRHLLPLYRRLFPGR